MGRNRETQINVRVKRLIAESFKLRAAQKGLNYRQAVEQALQFWGINTANAERVVPVRQAPMVKTPEIKELRATDLF